MFGSSIFLLKFATGCKGGERGAVPPDQIRSMLTMQPIAKLGWGDVPHLQN